MKSGNQITARTVTVAPDDTGRAGSKITVELSAHPDPRWQACFQFVVQGRDGFFMDARPVFDRGSFEGMVPPAHVDGFRQELNDVIAAANVLARAQANKDAPPRRR